MDWEEKGSSGICWETQYGFILIFREVFFCFWVPIEVLLT